MDAGSSFRDTVFCLFFFLKRDAARHWYVDIYQLENEHDNRKATMFEDVSPFEKADFPLPCWFAAWYLLENKFASDFTS